MPRRKIGNLPPDGRVQCKTEAFEAALEKRRHDRLPDGRRRTWDTIAEEAGCHRSMLSHLKSGSTITLRADLARRLAAALDVTPEAIFKLPDYDVLLEQRGARTR